MKQQRMDKVRTKIENENSERISDKLPEFTVNILPYHFVEDKNRGRLVTPALNLSLI